NLPLAAVSRRERPHVDLGVSRLIRPVSDPAPVGRKHGNQLVRLRAQEWLRLLRFGMIGIAKVQRQGPEVVSGLGVPFVVHQPPIGSEGPRVWTIRTVQ